MNQTAADITTDESSKSTKAMRADESFPQIYQNSHESKRDAAGIASFKNVVQKNKNAILFGLGVGLLYSTLDTFWAWLQLPASVRQGSVVGCLVLLALFVCIEPEKLFRDSKLASFLWGLLLILVGAPGIRGFVESQGVFGGILDFIVICPAVTLLVLWAGLNRSFQEDSAPE